MLAAAGLLIALAIGCFGQTIRVHITVLSTAPARIKVEGETAAATRDFSFLQTYAGAQGLGQRIEQFAASDPEGKSVSVKRLAPGEYTAQTPVTKWSYEVDLRPPDFPADAAYVSWLTNQRGLLMLKDLLPLPAPGTDPSKLELELNLSLPANWQGMSGERAQNSGKYSLPNWTSSVFYVGPAIHQATAKINRLDFTLISAGSWAFTDEDVLEMVANIIKYHQQSVGDADLSHATLIIAPFPTPQGANIWSAETRGRTVVLLSGQSPAKLPALAKLSVSLTHELFHLWIPNRLNLEGDYAWFYEGFALYQALRCGIALGYFTFTDFVNALGRAYDAYRRAPNFDQLTLAQAGERRWTGGNAIIYNKGLLAAFLLDANLRSHSGKHSLDEVYRALLREHGYDHPRVSAVPVVVAALQQNKDSIDLVERLITSSAALDLRSLAAPLGLQVDEIGGRTVLSATAKLTRGQRDLLREFGYNS